MAKELGNGEGNGKPKRVNGKKRHRGPGKPKGGPVLAPEKILQIEEWHLMGVRTSEIARRLKVNPEAIRHHILKNIEPRWRAEQRILFERELSKINLVERIAWTKFLESQSPEKRKVIREVLNKEGVATEVVEQATKWRTGEAHWIDLVKWAIEIRAKLGGLLIERSVVGHDVGVRIAGLKPEELTSAVFGEIVKRIEDRRAQRAALEAVVEEE